MPQPAGGLRARLIGEALYREVLACVDELGWADSTAVDNPINVIAEAVADDTEVALNTMAVAAEDVSGEESELGYASTDDSHVFYIDLFAESDWVSRAVMGDVRDWLRGRFPSNGRVRPILEVLDYEQATPTVVFACDIERVVEDVAHGFTQPWRRHWRSLRVELADEYLEDG